MLPVDFPLLDRERDKKVPVARWSGPPRHVILGDDLDVEGIQARLDFIFSTPAPILEIEAVIAGGFEERKLDFLVAYLRRKEDWTRKSASLILRISDEREFPAEKIKTWGALCRRDRVAEGPPPDRKLPADRLRMFWTSAAEKPEAWAQWIKGCGVRSFLLLRRNNDVEAFLSFYDGLVQACAELGIPEEWSRARREWLEETSQRVNPLSFFEGLDLFQEMAYAEDGSVFSSELGFQERKRNGDLFKLGELPAFRWTDLARHSLPGVLAAASEPRLQPICHLCTFRDVCRIPPSRFFKESNTVMGDPPNSPECRSTMGRLERLPQEIR